MFIERYVRVRNLWITCLTIVVCGFSNLSVAQVAPGDQAALDAALQQQDVAKSNAEAARQAAQKKKTSAPSDVTPPDPFAVPEGGPCFKIQTVNLTGYEPFGRKPDGFSSLFGTCATAADIGKALNQINGYYQGLGYITTRAYVPQQDVSDGSIEIAIVAGRIEGYVYGTGKQADRRIKAAFPSVRGDLLNLRKIEQGLDNINGPKLASAKFELVPGEEVGGSFIQVNVSDQRPFHFNLDFKNTGFDSTGVVKGAANFGYDNLLNLNDQLTFSYTTTPFESRAEKYSDAVTLGLDVPMGDWSFNFDATASRYHFILPGINQSYPVSGKSQSLTLSAERLLSRDQTSKKYAYGNLKVSHSRSFVDGNEIRTQRRRLTIATLGWRGEKSMPKGKWTWDISAKAGLNALGSYVFAQSIVDPQFKLLKGQVGYERVLGDTGLTYKGTFAFQHSDDVLPGSDQFSVGGWSNVRGYHDDNMYGDSGAYVQNTLSWDGYKSKNIEMKWHAGIDIGYVEASALRSWSQDHIVGATLGTEIIIQKQATLTLKLAHALSRPDENPPNAQPAFEAGKTIFYAGLKLEF